MVSFDSECHEENLRKDPKKGMQNIAKIRNN